MSFAPSCEKIERQLTNATVVRAMKNTELADIFARIADLMEILAENPFRINSYRRAARVVDRMPEAIEEVAAAGRLAEIPGIGKSTAEKIDEFLRAGTVALHEELKAKIPPDLPALLEVPGLGPKTVAKLWKQAGIASVEQLQAALEGDGESLTRVTGLGPKKVLQIRESLKFTQSAGGRILLGQADELAAGLLEQVAGAKGARRVAAAGSLRRGKETVGDIDLLCEAPRSAAEGIIRQFTASPNVKRVLAAGKTKGSVILDVDVQCDLRVVGKAGFGAALSYFTGSKAHNVRLRELAVKAGMKLNEYGLFKADKRIAGRDEEGIFKALGLAYVPPELREDSGELAAASADKLPDLLETSDIRGDLHVHTTASDGANTVEEMIQAAREHGYEYLGICDHSRSQVQAHGLTAERLTEHVKAIRRVGRKYGDILTLAGIEVDIFKDGSLDFGPDVLAELDFVTASPHSALSQGRKDATRRLIRAIEQPHVHCIGHPSGRLINRRAGMEIDIDKIARAAAVNDVALEVNAHYFRLDLRDTHVRAAIRCGAKIIINTDAHGIAGLDMMKYGVTTARRGWATAADVVNTYTREKLTGWLAKKR